ncbi:GGDEF domain-containing protein [Kineosporia babensis]|uniref:GGDEF domain-containing protein n=1 Tax=Kineosporia babensis TaxID=499548 RepID=A0A9X1NIG9_9ACTN|nr:GGDEF domain-containing protein [Kineosporia babensis]MCD5315647.1 GGDEF domain-containing protein [Kineosporia babensis]
MTRPTEPTENSTQARMGRLRKRLAVALAVVAVVPLLAGAVLLGLLAPAHARSAATGAAARDADAAAVTLSGSCDALRASTRVAAGEVAAFATRNAGTVTREAAQTFADRAVARRPGSAVAVFDAQARLLAGAGPLPAREIAESIGAQGLDTGPSCAAGRAATVVDDAGLAEISPVLINPAGTTAKVDVASVVMWLPLNQASLSTLGARLGTSSELSVLAAAGQPVVLASTVDGPDLARLLRRLPTSGAAEGTYEGLGYRLTEAGPGVPYRVLATNQVGGSGLRLLGWGLLALALVALGPLWFVLVRLTRPVSDELDAVGDELEAGRLALADSLDRFGEVLAHTHDLNELLATVTGATLSGTNAAAAAILLVADEVDPSPPVVPNGRRSAEAGRRGSDQAEARPGDRLSVHAEAGRPDTRGERARAVLPAFAERHFAELMAKPQVFEPTLIDLPGAGPVAAIGVGVDSLPVESSAERVAGRRRLIGVLVVARGEGGPAFDALNLTRLRALAAQTGSAITNIRRYLEVRRLSMTDTLTGLGNRAQLVSALSREIAAASRGEGVLTVLMLDIDHFKQVNDTWGHGFGDVVLRDFADRLLACVREADTVARYGGEEFVVLLRDTDVDGGCRVAERVLDAARSRPFEEADVSQPVTVSIGVAAYPRDGRSADDVLQAADSALYAAKRDGRNRWRVAEPSHNAPIPSLPG